MTEHSHHDEMCKCGEECRCAERAYNKCMEDKGYCSEKFMKLADEAWMEVLKEKIKAEIERNKGGKIEELARIIAKANGEKWRHKMEMKTELEDYRHSMEEFFKNK